MKLQSLPELSSLLSPELSVYLLLEYTPALRERLYQDSANPVFVPLFQDTPLHELSAQSPLLLPVSPEHDLYPAFTEAPEDWPGLLLQTGVTQPELLLSLRRALLVRFDVVRRAVLRYYDPRVASYFFPACSAKDLNSWFHPVRLVAWHGATWADESEHGKAWQVIQQPKQMALIQQEGEPRLTESQEQALSQMDRERFVSTWCRSSGYTSFASASHYLEEGLTLGIQDSNILSEFLTLRVDHPLAELPSPSILSGDESHRMQLIRSHMERAPLSNMEKLANIEKLANMEKLA